MDELRWYITVYCYEVLSGRCALNSGSVEACVEKLCHKGCRAVWSDIRTLEAGRRLPEAQGLSAAEIDAVVSELKSIMSVYDGSCAAV